MEKTDSMEIERKYLIRMPDRAYLDSLVDAEVWDITQIYLCDGDDGSTRRVRRVECDGNIKYIYNEKQRVGGISHAEREWEIDLSEYESLCGRSNTVCRPIIKRRYRYPFRDQMIELDVYSFWTDRATVEIEIDSEDQPVYLPEGIDVIRDVSTESAYRNRRLAERVPMEEI